MAEKRVWFGSMGPFLFDDADEYDPVNEPGNTIKGMRAEGTVAAENLEGNLQGFNSALKRSFLL